MSSRGLIVLTLCAVFVCACGQAQDQQANEQATEVDAPSLVVIGVEVNDVLNVRTEPSADAALVGTLAPNARGIRVTAQAAESLDWIHIDANGLQGWVNASYLGYANSYAPLPIRLHCSGTEPFWGMELSYSRADVTFAFDEEDFRAGFNAPTSPAGRTNSWFRTRFERETEFLVIETETCSDGMSDRSYPYSTLVKLEDNLLAGCCR